MRLAALIVLSLPLSVIACESSEPSDTGSPGSPAPPTEEPGPGPAGFAVFQPPVLVCQDPVAGEPAGQSEGGQVCTWQMMSGCTEPGRNFSDYASCDTVRTQRPYAPAPPPEPPVAQDPRMQDPAYVAELDWVREQVEACACVCCHQGSKTPSGASIWDIEAEDNWVNTFSPYGLAFAGGFIDSSLLGAYPASENNGFSRENLGIPSTDPERMARFFEGELVFRGMSPVDFADEPPTPDFFYQQSIYEPTACAPNEGVGADGTVTWNGPPSRYIYVLEADAPNPGVPPNLDLPAGTLWRLDVAPDRDALPPGAVRYGAVPEGMKQGFPREGAPPALESGKTYYLYVMLDMAFPVTRCLFTYP